MTTTFATRTMKVPARVRRWLGGASVRERLKAMKRFRVVGESDQLVHLEYTVPLFADPMDRLSARLDLPRSFYDTRRAWIEVSPKITNHDYLAFHCFCQLLDTVPSDPVRVVEFGVFRGIFLCNLAEHAERTGRRLDITAIDTFETFPDTVAKEDVESANRSNLEAMMRATTPHSVDEIRRKLEAYKSVVALRTLKTDILALRDERFAGELVHIDTDTHASVRHALRLVETAASLYVVVDDYYQPSWSGVVPAVNEICRERGLAPATLADYCGVPRSLRTSFIAVLLPKRSPGVMALDTLDRP